MYKIKSKIIYNNLNKDIIQRITKLIYIYAYRNQRKRTNNGRYQNTSEENLKGKQLNLSDSQHSAKQKSGEDIVVIGIITQPHLNLKKEKNNARRR